MRPPESPSVPVADSSVQPDVEGEEEDTEKEYIPPPPPPPANSLVRIVDPAVIDQLQLTAAQRTEAFRLVNVQALELSKAHAVNAPPEQFLAIYKQTEDALSNLLTDLQKARLTAGIESETFILVFDKQPWVNVLQSIAAQGGYHLNMTAVPPGTFTYDEPDKRTIIQVLNLLNGILITEGFNITRKGRILQVIDLRKPYTNWTFPEMRVEDLKDRAASEFVQVRHSWGRRPSDRVLATLEPLKNNNPFIQMFPAGNTVLIIDRVEIQNSIQGIIARTEEPPPSPTPPMQERQRRAPAPTWHTYTIEYMNPDNVMNILQQHVGARMIRLENSKEIHVYGRQAQHYQIESLLKMLEADSSVVRKKEAEAEKEPEKEKKETHRIVPYSITPYFAPRGR